MKRDKLAKWLHDNYEQIAKEKDWRTQKNCRVEFGNLPKENKRVMLELADRLIWVYSIEDRLNEETKINEDYEYYTDKNGKLQIL